MNTILKELLIYPSRNIGLQQIIGRSKESIIKQCQELGPLYLYKGCFLWLIYRKLDDWVKKRNHFTNIFKCILIHPLCVIHVKYLINNQTIIQTIQQIYKQKGIFGFFVAVHYKIILEILVLLINSDNKIDMSIKNLVLQFFKMLTYFREKQFIQPQSKWKKGGDKYMLTSFFFEQLLYINVNLNSKQL